MEVNDKFVGLIRFYGPFADEGLLDIEKAGKSLVALNRILNRYQKDVRKINKEEKFILRISSVNKNCTELVCVLDRVVDIAGHSDVFINAALVSHAVGFQEFGKQFFGTLGQQLALRVFSKGQNLQEVGNELSQKREVLTKVCNKEGETRSIPTEEWENYKILNPYLDEFVQLEKGKENEMSIGYTENGKVRELVRVQYEQKKFFEGSDDSSVETRLNDPFDEASAKYIRIVGKFVDYYGLAHKYHFSFQARKNQDDTGKQKILCILPEEQISEIIDYLKPENNKENICIYGKATRDWEGRIDKIKIEWVNPDENYNPNQSSLA